MAPPVPAARPAATMDEVIIPMTHSLLEEALHKAADRATSTARQQATRELKQSLEAQQAALDQRHAEALGAQRVALEEQMIHRVRAARLWAALVAFILGAVVFGVGGAKFERDRLTAGAEVGIDAMARSRQLDDILERQREQPPEEPCTNQSCAPGQRTPAGTQFRSPEPADAPEGRTRRTQ